MILTNVERLLRVEAVWKLDVRVIVRKVDLSDRHRIDDRHRGRGSMTPEIVRRQSFHTASVGTTRSRCRGAVVGASRPLGSDPRSAVPRLAADRGQRWRPSRASA